MGEDTAFRVALSRHGGRPRLRWANNVSPDVRGSKIAADFGILHSNKNIKRYHKLHLILGVGLANKTN